MEEEDFIDPKNLPIYKKGKEIFEVVHQICELIPDDNEILQHTKEHMLADAAMLTVKVAGAEGGGLYDLKMENATIIRKAARDLLVQNHSLEAFGFKEVAYFQIVRDLIEEYRLLFIDWVAGFDQWDYIIDRWGLFNPPGIGPFDKDTDDDVPFDPNDFLE
ncbi:hypothetical protein [Fulvivirga lutea]|uniref:Uncharacterized protein n=1 Tax=Fulvivirga lutea TaxID=2810512 RepID=A0A974WFB6_9BACT|nr:hypothetical protein [Fulvivirga lutea]QSE96679.1 hypothetical protein JR347_13895 [Fulvivirga lutea]